MSDSRLQVESDFQVHDGSDCIWYTLLFSGALTTGQSLGQEKPGLQLLSPQKCSFSSHIVLIFGAEVLYSSKKLLSPTSCFSLFFWLLAFTLKASPLSLFFFFFLTSLPSEYRSKFKREAELAPELGNHSGLQARNVYLKIQSMDPRWNQRLSKQSQMNPCLLQKGQPDRWTALFKGCLGTQ